MTTNYNVICVRNTIFILLFLLFDNCYSQKSNNLKQNFRIDSFWESIIDDGVNEESTISWTSIGLSILKKNTINISDTISLLTNDFRRFSLNCLYINNENTKYVLLFCSDENYDNLNIYRIEGYKFCDFVHFYEFLRKQRFSKKEINEIFLKLQQTTTGQNIFDLKSILQSMRKKQNYVVGSKSTILSKPKIAIVYSNGDQTPQIFSERNNESIFSRKPFYTSIFY
jgi:hypothetical protein